MRISQSSKIKTCNKCHEPRVFLVEAKVYTGTTGLVAHLKWLCIPCLLGVMRLQGREADVYDRPKADACVETNAVVQGASA